MTVPTTMLALTQTQAGYDAQAQGMEMDSLEPYLSAQQLTVPKPGPGQVLIKVRMAAVNPSDRYFIKGNYGQPRVKGAAAGFEAVGDVVAVGSGLFARSLKGKRVAFAATGKNSTGTWAEYALTEAATCVPLIAGVKDEDGAGFIVNPMTAAAMIDLVKESGSQSFVLSAAASQIGKLMISMASDSGLRPIALVRRDEQMPALIELGAQFAFNITDPDVLANLATRFRAEQTRTFLDAVAGNTEVGVFEAMPRAAKWFIYGGLGAEDTRLPDISQMIFMGKQMNGFWLTSWMRRVSLLKKISVARHVQRGFADGRWHTDIGETVDLANAMTDLLPALNQGNGKVLIKM